MRSGAGRRAAAPGAALSALRRLDRTVLHLSTPGMAGAQRTAGTDVEPKWQPRSLANHSERGTLAAESGANSNAHPVIPP